MDIKTYTDGVLERIRRVHPHMKIITRYRLQKGGHDIYCYLDSGADYEIIGYQYSILDKTLNKKPRGLASSSATKVIAVFNRFLAENEIKRAPQTPLDYIVVFPCPECNALHENEKEAENCCK